ncbi:hypothetical protein RHMOL_Rhmol01G0339700 [Rhododendron molle]|uniref:Uncharacterized protein n=1 Tax=Rhododendron molle TaxID=49168 RepID=A0ACC0Q923_RHOML|nr:hypothetical protein RHMOL_Rhmol01G0339700 [Rhododendron molle]
MGYIYSAVQNAGIVLVFWRGRKVGQESKMIVPVRCFTCGKVIGNKWDMYLDLLQSNNGELCKFEFFFPAKLDPVTGVEYGSGSLVQFRSIDSSVSLMLWRSLKELEEAYGVARTQ